MSKKKVDGKPGVVMPGKMSPEALAQWQLLRTRGRRFADGRKKASKRACRRNSAGRGDS